MKPLPLLTLVARTHAAGSTAGLVRHPGSRVDSRPEARTGLVLVSVFKTDGAPRERRHGGFDSHALPPA